MNINICIIDSCGEEAKSLLCRAHLKQWHEYESGFPGRTSADEKSVGPFSVNRIVASRFVRFYFSACKEMAK